MVFERVFQRVWTRLRAFTTDPDSEEQIDEVMGERVLIIGLGNPGREHRANRHNVGFMAVDRLAAAHSIALNRMQAQAIVGSGTLGGRPVILAKPQTFMNRSGITVGALARFYKIAPQNILVIFDDLDIPRGALRLRAKGGAGGHNGMRSIIEQLGEDFPRLRLGIGRPPARMEAAAYVLQDFGPAEQADLNMLLEAAVQAVETFVRDGVDMAMTRHNGTA